MSIYTLIDTLSTPSSGVFDFPSLTFTGYRAIEIVCSALTVTTDDTECVLQFYVGGVLITSGYRFSTKIIMSSIVTRGDGAITGTGIRIQGNVATFGVGNAAGERLGSIIHVDNPLNTTRYKRAIWESVLAVPSGNRHMHSGMGFMENTGAISGLRIAADSNLLTGNVRVLGMA